MIDILKEFFLEHFDEFLRLDVMIPLDKFSGLCYLNLSNFYLQLAVLDLAGIFNTTTLYLIHKHMLLFQLLLYLVSF